MAKAAVSKRLAPIERSARISLVNRSTRCVRLKPEGETAAERARLILADIDELDCLLTGSAPLPKGLLEANVRLGFGPGHVAPLHGPRLYGPKPPLQAVKPSVWRVLTEAIRP